MSRTWVGGSIRIVRLDVDDRNRDYLVVSCESADGRLFAFDFHAAVNARRGAKPGTPEHQSALELTKLLEDAYKGRTGIDLDTLPLGRAPIVELQPCSGA